MKTKLQKSLIRSVACIVAMSVSQAYSDTNSLLEVQPKLAAPLMVNQLNGGPIQKVSADISQSIQEPLLTMYDELEYDKSEFYESENLLIESPLKGDLTQDESLVKETYGLQSADLQNYDHIQNYAHIIQFLPTEEEYYDLLAKETEQGIDPNEVYPYFDLINNSLYDYHTFVHSFLTYLDIPIGDYSGLYQLITAGDVIRFRAKSFIGPVPLPQKAPPGANNFLFNQFVGLTNSSFSETAKGNSYRIEGDLSVMVVCQKGNIIDWSSSGVTAGNKAVEPPNITKAAKNFAAFWGIKVPLSVDPGIVKTPYVKSARKVNNTIELDWAVFGAPHATGIMAMNFIANKKADHIWHRIEATIGCNGDKAVVISSALTGTLFPSHALFVNKVLKTELTQGPIANLWNFTPGDTFKSGKKTINHLPSASKIPAYFKK